MTYCISDIHGEYYLLCRLLELIGFCDTDTLIVAGDMINKGSDSVKVMQMLGKMANAECIIGNHEYQFLKFYNSLMRSAVTDYEEVLTKLRNYFPGEKGLVWKDLDWLEGLPHYLEYDDFAVIHSGWPRGSNREFVPLKDASIEACVYDRTFKEPSVMFPGDQCVIFGHTPTNDYRIHLYQRDDCADDRCSIRVYSKIHIDTGVYLSNTLGCICVETLRTYYVHK